MQVGNNFSYEINKNPNMQVGNNKQNCISVPVSQQQNTNFGQEPAQNNPEPKKKNPYSLKNMTNVLGVALGICAIAVPIIINHRKAEAVKLYKKANNLEKKINFAKVTTKEMLDKTEPGYKKGNAIQRFGNAFNKLTVEHGEEIVNNIVYGIGTVIIMPLVILLSPFGKEKSSKEDRLFTILRQPLSFATMFSMQLTVDKYFKDLVPEIIKRNVLEDKDLLDKNNKFKEGIDSGKIKFNSGAIKSDIKSILKRDLRYSNETIGRYYKDTDDQHTLIKKFLTEQLEDVNPKLLASLENKLDAQSIAVKREKLLAQTLVIATNVLFSAPVGCTLLNVLYGKMMKKYGSKASETQQDNAVKGGNK